MFIIAALAGDLADLPETVRIKQAFQPFARIELALPVLPCELLLAPIFSASASRSRRCSISLSQLMRFA